MKIIGFMIKKVSAEKLKDPAQGMEISSGLNIESIEKTDTDFTKNDTIKFDFVYTVNYNPNFAKIEIKGSVVVLDDKGESKNLLKEWKNKKFDHPIKLPLFNFIMDKCGLKAVQLEEEIGMPFHVPFPRLAPAQNQDEKGKSKTSYTG